MMFPVDAQHSQCLNPFFLFWRGLAFDDLSTRCTNQIVKLLETLEDIVALFAIAVRLYDNCIRLFGIEARNRKLLM